MCPVNSGILILTGWHGAICDGLLLGMLMGVSALKGVGSLLGVLVGD